PASHVMLRDITERKRAQEELRRSAEDLEAWKKRHDAIVQASGQVLYSWDIERNTISWSGNLKGIGGYEALPTDLSKAMELIHPEDRPRVETAVSRVTP